MFHGTIFIIIRCRKKVAQLNSMFYYIWVYLYCYEKCKVFITAAYIFYLF